MLSIASMARSRASRKAGETDGLETVFKPPSFWIVAISFPNGVVEAAWEGWTMKGEAQLVVDTRNATRGIDSTNLVRC